MNKNKSNQIRIWATYEQVVDHIYGVNSTDPLQFLLLSSISFPTSTNLNSYRGKMEQHS